jgi:hypothetical protein
MTINAQHIAAALALLAVGYMIGKRQAASAQGAAAYNETAGSTEQWWSYAGSWAI